MTTKVTNVYNLKLTPSQFGQNSIVVNCSQYDSLYRVIQFNLLNGNAPYSIPDNSVVTIRGTKKDMTGFEYECDYSNNVVTFPIQQQITIYPGKVPAELRITSGNEIIGSWNFVFLVEESPLSNNTIISETDLPLLESALQAASEAESYKDMASEYADNANSYAEDSEAYAIGTRGGVEVTSDDVAYENNSKYYSILADDSAREASIFATNAQTYASNAEESATNASESEANALTYSQNASQSASESAQSAQSASESATRAETSAQGIEQYVEDAQEYASQASQSATNAQTYASNASTSATNAQQSATSAQTYAQNAQTSASNASQSATSAQTFASNASTSASNASASATQASQSASSAQTYASNASTSATQAQGYASDASDSATASADSATESQGYAQSASDSATQAQTAIETIDEAIKNKADIDGVYPKLVAGDIVETEVKDDVFTYQKTDHTGKANINSIKGNTIVWNQLIQNGNFESTSGWWAPPAQATLTASDNTLIATALTSQSPYITVQNNLKKDHKYLFLLDIYPQEVATVSIPIYGNTRITNIPANTWTKLSSMFTRTADTTTATMYFGYTDNTNKVTKFKNFQIFDLTAMFGAGNEPTSVAEFTKLFSLPYYAYNAGEPLSFNGTGIKVTGKNLVFKILSSANLGGDGIIVADAQNMYDLAVAEVVGGKQYHIGNNRNDSAIIGWFTSEPQIGSIAYDGQRIVGSSLTPIAPITGYIVFRIDKPFAEPTFNLGTGNIDYEPYKESSLSLPIAQYFPNGMDGVGTDYDELTESKAYHRMARVDLGTLNYTYDSTVPRFYTTDINSLVKKPLNSANKANAISSMYENTSFDRLYASEKKNMTMAFGTTGTFNVINTSYTDANTFKSAMSGVYLVYPLANPIEVDADLDLSYNTYEGGTEQLLPVNTDVPVTSPISMNVEFDFGENLNARFNKVLSMIAPVESAQVSKAYSVGQYLIYDYTLYKVTSAIASGGTITVGTNVTATTLAEILENL